MDLENETIAEEILIERGEGLIPGKVSRGAAQCELGGGIRAGRNDVKDIKIQGFIRWGDGGESPPSLKFPPHIWNYPPPIRVSPRPFEMGGKFHKTVKFIR